MSHEVDDYILQYPEDVQERLQTVRAMMKEIAPDCVEKINYGMPAFALRKNFAYIAGHTKHIAMYPGALCMEAFGESLKGYKTSKGTVHFPMSKPLPLDLIKQMVVFSIENL